MLTAIDNGGLYIKFGQGLAALNHILNPVYITTLAKLNDMALSSAPDDIDEIFSEDFGGQDVKDMFIELNRKPIAAASIAQVFDAKLKDGTKVALKMQYIDLQDRFAGTSDDRKMGSCKIMYYEPTRVLSMYISLLGSSLIPSQTKVELSTEF